METWQKNLPYWTAELNLYDIHTHWKVFTLKPQMVSLFMSTLVHFSAAWDMLKIEREREWERGIKRRDLWCCKITNMWCWTYAPLSGEKSLMNLELCVLCRCVFECLYVITAYRGVSERIMSSVHHCLAAYCICNISPSFRNSSHCLSLMTAY